MRPGFLNGTGYWFGELPERHYTQSQSYQDQVELKYLGPDDYGLTSPEYSFVKPTVHRDSRGDRPIWTRLINLGGRLFGFKM